MAEERSAGVFPGARLKQAIEERGLKQKAVAQRIGISEGHLSDIVRGKGRLTAENAGLIEDNFAIDAGWLLMGRPSQEHEAPSYPPDGLLAPRPVVVYKCPRCLGVVDRPAAVCRHCGAGLTWAAAAERRDEPAHAHRGAPS